MPAHEPIIPARAIELVEAAGFQDAQTILADFAAAGLIRTYALARETGSVGLPVEVIRDGQIPAMVWQRIVSEQRVADALSGGTVRIEGSELRGGLPSVQITGVSFSEGSLVKVLARYCRAPAQSCSPARVRPSNPEQSAMPKNKCGSGSQSSEGNKQVPSINPSDLFASVAQTMQATGLGRTKINELMRVGILERRKAGRRSLITIESIRRLSGADSDNVPPVP